jgi:DNA-binding NtrC family response regulator
VFAPRREIYEEIGMLDARIPVIFVTGAKTADTAIEAMKRGAFNYLYKPLDLQQLRATMLEALEVARRVRAPVLLAQAAPDPCARHFGSAPDRMRRRVRCVINGKSSVEIPSQLQRLDPER